MRVIYWKKGHKTYIHFVRNLKWLFTIERADIQYFVCSLSCYSVCSHKGQLKAVERVYCYLKVIPDMCIKVHNWDFSSFFMLPAPDVSLKERYPNAYKQSSEQFHAACELPIQSSVFFNSDLVHNQKTNRDFNGITVCM